MLNIFWHFDFPFMHTELRNLFRYMGMKYSALKELKHVLLGGV